MFTLEVLVNRLLESLAIWYSSAETSGTADTSRIDTSICDLSGDGKVVSILDAGWSGRCLSGEVALSAKGWAAPGYGQHLIDPRQRCE